MVSPYEVLGVDPDASAEEIQAAYRSRVKEVHPDQGGTQRDFFRVQSAYQELSGEDGGYHGHRSPSQGPRHWSTSEPTSTVLCSNCGASIPTPSDAILGEFDDQLFCRDCVVDTACGVCGTPLTLTQPRFNELDGNPICESCFHDTTEVCTRCGTTIHHEREAVTLGSNETYCPDCVVETDCRGCGDTLFFTVDEFAELTDDPTCSACSDTSSATDPHLSPFPSLRNFLFWLAVGGLLGMVIVVVLLSV